MLGTEKIELIFDDNGIDKIAELATEINQNVENIGGLYQKEKRLIRVSTNLSLKGWQLVYVIGRGGCAG